MRLEIAVAESLSFPSIEPVPVLFSVRWNAIFSKSVLVRRQGGCSEKVWKVAVLRKNLYRKAEGRERNFTLSRVYISRRRKKVYVNDAVASTNASPEIQISGWKTTNETKTVPHHVPLSIFNIMKRYMPHRTNYLKLLPIARWVNRAPAIEPENVL